MIDDTLAKAASLVRSTGSELGVVTDRVEAARLELARWDHVEAMDVDFTALGFTRTRCEDAVRDAESLFNLIEEGRRKLRESRVARECADALGGVLEVALVAVKANVDRDALASTVSDLQRHEAAAAIRIPHLGDLEARAEAACKAADEVADLQSYVDDFKAANLEQSDTRVAHEDAEIEWTESMGDWCPLCMQKLIP